MHTRWFSWIRGGWFLRWYWIFFRIVRRLQVHVQWCGLVRRERIRRGGIVCLRFGFCFFAGFNLFYLLQKIVYVLAQLDGIYFRVLTLRSHYLSCIPHIYRLVFFKTGLA